MIRDAAERIIKKETADLKKIVKESFQNRDAIDFEDAVAEYYAGRFEDFTFLRMSKVFRGYGKVVAQIAAVEAGSEQSEVMSDDPLKKFTDQYARAFISRHITKSQHKLNNALEKGQEEELEGIESGTQETVNAEIDEWYARTANIARNEGTARENGQDNRSF